MRFALFGADADVVQLAVAVCVCTEHQLVAAFAPGAHAQAIGGLAPGIRFDEDWEALLGGGLADAVVVAAEPARDAAGADQRTRRLRNLVQAGLPLLLVHPACEATVGYELEWLARDERVVLWPYYPGDSHPAVAYLAELVARGDAAEIGRAEQLLVERTLVPMSGGTWFHLARDASLLRSICGPASQVSAVGAGSAGSDPAPVSVTMTSQRGLLIRWSAKEGGDAETARLTLQGHRGRATWELSPPRRPGPLTVEGRTPSVVAMADWDEFAAAVRAFAEAVAGQVAHARWLEVGLDLELAEAARRSLARGQTLQLPERDLSETAAFKGTVAVGGCLLLCLVVAVLVAVGLAEGLGLPVSVSWLWRTAVAVLLALLAIFLALPWLKPSDRNIARNS